MSEKKTKHSQLPYQEITRRTSDLSQTVLWANLAKPLTTKAVDSLLEQEEERLETVHHLNLAELDRILQGTKAKKNLLKKIGRVFSNAEDPNVPPKIDWAYHQFLRRLTFLEGSPDDYLLEYIQKLKEIFKKFPGEVPKFKWEARSVFTNINGKWVLPSHWSEDVVTELLALTGFDESEASRKIKGDLAPVPITGIRDVARAFVTNSSQKENLLQFWLDSMEGRIKAGEVKLEVLISNWKAFRETGYIAPESVGPFQGLLTKEISQIVVGLINNLQLVNFGETKDFLARIAKLIDNAQLPLDLSTLSWPVERQQQILAGFTKDFAVRRVFLEDGRGRSQILAEKKAGQGQSEYYEAARNTSTLILQTGPSGFVYELELLSQFFGQFEPRLLQQACADVLPFLVELPDNWEEDYVYNYPILMYSMRKTTQEIYQQLYEEMATVAAEKLGLNLPE